MLAAAMPRSGGDYVYVSRVLGPSWGMMSSLNNTIWWILYGGVPSAFFAYYGLTPLLRSLGVLTNDATLIRYGNDLSTPAGAFIVGTALIAVLVVIFALGLNLYFKIQNVLFLVAMVGILSDWGFFHTVETNIAKVVNFARDRLEAPVSHAVADSARRITEAMQAAPKSLKWKVRARGRTGSLVRAPRRARVPPPDDGAWHVARCRTAGREPALTVPRRLAATR